MNPSGIREEQHIIMGRGHKNALHIVLFLQILAVDSPATPALAPVGVHGHPLDVALTGEGIAAVLFFNEVLYIDFLFHVLDLRLPAVAKLIPDGCELFLQNALDQMNIF